MQEQQLLSPKRLKLIIILVIILLAAWIGSILYRVSTFHVVKTNPSVGSVTTITPFLDVYFNRELSQSGLSITSSPQIILSHTVSGKILKLNLTSPLQANKSYTISINAITDTAGKTLTNAHFTVTPSAVNYNQLPTDQQKAILQRQEAGSASTAPSFIGTDALLNNGLSTVQVTAFQQDIQTFAQTNKIDLRTVSIDSSSVTPGPLTSSGIFTLTFSVAINNKNYNATIQCSGIVTIDLTLSDPTSGAQVFATGGPS